METEFVASARSWIGTPWVHCGRSRNGIDCTGLIIVCLNEVGFNVDVEQNYSMQDEWNLLVNECSKYATRVDPDHMRPGDLILFRGRMMYNHCGILTPENTFVHAYNTGTTGRVVETPLEGKWKSRIAEVFRPRWPHSF